MTQQQLADLADIPRATLATVERDDANPSLVVVFKIATALGMTIDDLVESSQRLIRHISAAEMRQVTSGDGAYRATSVSPSSVFHMSQLVFSLGSGGTYQGSPHPPGSEEYIHILQGEIDLEVAGEHLLLNTGDTASFHGNVRHVYRNPGLGEGKAVVTILEGVGLDGAGKENLD